MGNLIQYEDIVPFGRTDDGVLKIEKSFKVDAKHDGSLECILVSAFCSYTGIFQPKIYFELSTVWQDTSLCPYHLGWINLLPPDPNRPIYSSHKYRIGRQNEFTLQSWRVPPMFSRDMIMSVIFEIPEGTTLLVKSFGSEHAAPTRQSNSPLRFNAHLGFWGLAPENTMLSYELAAKCGFDTCIVVPKLTRDGVFVCLHDETLTKTARDKYGNAPDRELFVSDMTYSELLKWDFGAYRNELFRGTKIPLLEDFFALCAKTGMRPMFSTHPNFTNAKWREIRWMLEKHGLLEMFHVKSGGLNILKDAFAVFGDEIDGYTWDKSCIDEELIRQFEDTGISPDRCRVGIEVQMDKYTSEIANLITENGYFASAWAIKRRDFEEYERLISYGVTEFTEDYHCSMGLNF